MKQDFVQSDGENARSSSAPAQGNPLATASAASVVLSVIFLAVAAFFWDDITTFGVCIVMAFLASITAIVLGHLAMRRINRSFENVRGYRAARMGLRLGYFITFVGPVAASLAVPTFSKICARGNQTQAISNCRQIITTLRLYSSDNGGKYPDGIHPEVQTSNEAFRWMFVGGQADNEQIFGSPVSVFHPDGNIGSPPDYKEALKPGENHWAMTRGLDDSMDGSYPLVFESPIEATWPPKWNANLTGTSKPGRTWENGRIAVGMNDSSVALHNFDSVQGERVGFEKNLEGKDLFAANPKKLSVLNVAR